MVLSYDLQQNVSVELLNRRNGVVVRASASQSVDLGFIPLVELYRKTLKNGIYSFPAWCSAVMGSCGEQAGKVVVVVYPTPSEGWGHGGTPWSPRSRATPQGLDQRSKRDRVAKK